MGSLEGKRGRALALRAMVLATVGAVLAGCRTASPVGVPQRGTTTSGHDPVAWYQRCLDLENARSWSQLGECYADDVTSEQLGLASVRGKEAAVGSRAAWSAAFADGKSEPQFVLIDGHDALSVRWFHGTQSGPYRGPLGEVAPTNRYVGLLLFHHAHLNDQWQIDHERWAWDVATLMFQLGASPGPARHAMDRGWPGAPIVAVSNQSDAEKKNLETVRQMYALWNKRDMPAFYAMIPEDVVESFNSEAEDTVGRKALEKENDGWMSSFSDNRVDVDGVWAAGPYTVAFEHLRGTNDGDLGSQRKTGRKVDVPMYEILRWGDGKCTRSWPFLNGMQMTAQLAGTSN